MGCPTEQILRAVAPRRLALATWWCRDALVAARDVWFAPKELGGSGSLGAELPSLK